MLRGTGDGTFTRADVAALGQHPRGIAVADVNRDDRPDLIYSAYATGAVQVLNGDGAGGFTKGAAYISTALVAQGLGTADFNRDGFLDIAVAYPSSTGLLRILYGNGGTSFSARTVTYGTNLNVLDVGDFNHDGWMDVAAASTAGNWVTISTGGIGGVFATYIAVVGSSPRGITVAHVNDDGLADSVTANRASNTVSVLLGDPAHRGAFLPAREFGADARSRDVVAADFNRDGISIWRPATSSPVARRCSRRGRASSTPHSRSKASTHVLGIETDRRGEQVAKAAQHKARGDERHDGQGDLGDDKASLQGTTA